MFEKADEIIEVQANKKLLIFVGILVILIVIMFNLAGLLGILAIMLSIYVLVYVCCALNGKVEIYEDYLKIYPNSLGNKYQRSLWDRKVKIPWQDIYYISFEKKGILKNVPYIENLIMKINIYDRNMAMIAQQNVIFADNNYWAQIKSAFKSKDISVLDDDDELNNNDNDVDNIRNNSYTINNDNEVKVMPSECKKQKKTQVSKERKRGRHIDLS